MRKLIISCVTVAAMLTCIIATAQQKDGKPTVYMVGNAHFDTQWRWTVQTSIDEYLYKTLVQNFALFEDYPDYVFNFEGAVKYRWAKEYYPDLFEKLRQYVAQGRWHISGASWDANDPNMPSIESGIRNILLGQEFYRKEFGILSTDIMLPDCFGFGYQLPSIAAHCGLIGFGTQKLAWRKNALYPDGRKYPFLFGIWKGLDGERLMAALDGKGYSWSPDSPITDRDEFKEMISISAVPAVYRYFGTGDRGGSATPTGVKYVSEAVQNPGAAYNVRFAASDDMFKDYLWNNRLPEYDGELLMDVHATGNYTSKVEMKMLNRRNERMLGAAEEVSSMADMFGGISYPSYTIDEGWKRILWHQFHDDLTGTSTPEAYQFSYNDEYLNLNQMKGIIESGMLSMASIMDTRTNGSPILVFNHVSAKNEDYAGMEMDIPDGCRSVEVYGPDGKKVKSQIIGRTPGKATVIFCGVMPSLGLSVYGVKPSTKAEKASEALKASGNCIENRIYKVRVGDDGDIVSIVDKRYGKELVREGEAIGYDFISGNESNVYPAWEIFKEVVDRKPEKVNGEVRISVEECGPVRAVLKVERSHAGSTFIQRIMLTDGAADDRIDIVNTIDWNSRAALLKATFPVSFDAAEATYDLGMGHVRRGSNTEAQYEVVAQQWADMTADDGSYGVTVINDGKYGWDKPDGHTIRLTLFHTPTAVGRFTEQQTQDFGEHTFTYSIVGHKGTLDPALTDMKADKLNQHKIVVAVPAHGGKLGKSFSLASSTSPALRIKAFKKAQDGDGFIVRVYELTGNGAEGKILFPNDIASAVEVNGIEDPKGPASYYGNTLNVKSSGFALKTFRVRLQKHAVSIESPAFTSVGLPYNTVAFTSDPYYGFGMLGKDRDSFAAELMPEDFEYKGIPFAFGKPDYKDAVSCEGQTIEVPEGFTVMHLLVASSEAEGSEVAFMAGNNEYRRSISCFKGFYGLYGWPGYYESVLRTDDVAYIGTHTHNSHTRNLAYVPSYMYLISIPTAGVTSIQLPDNDDIIIFAATAER